MIYLFTGTDEQKVRSKAFDWISRARAKEPQLAYARISQEDLSPEALESAAISEGLFIKRLLVLIDDPFSGAASAKSENPVIDQLKFLADSNNAIVILAPKLSAAFLKKIETKAKLTYTFDKEKEIDRNRGFNTGLVSAFASRSKDKLWLEIVRALRAGDAPEMLHGLLHWKARDLMEKGSRVWTPHEARELSLKLIELLHDSRSGGLELAPALERFALAI